MKSRTSSEPFTPDWCETAPDKRSYRSIFKWGAPDTFKHPNKELYELLKIKLQLQDEDFSQTIDTGQEEIGPVRESDIPENQVHALVDIVGKDNIDLDDYSRIKHSFGKTTEEAFQLRQGKVDCVTDLVVHPESKDEVRQIVKLCDKNRLPIYVYSGGSSVNFGFKPVKGGVTLNMSTHMNKVLDLNEENQTIRIQPGMMGPDYEQTLNNADKIFGAKQNYTGGHFPQSFEFSSVGGWIATLGSGQQSSYYGDAGDLVISQEYITPSGDIKTLDYPATATGPKVNDMLKGSEGCYGILVEVTMKIFRYQPLNRRNFSFIFPSWESAVEACREISQGEFGMPSVLRISDAEETDVALRLYGIENGIIDKVIKLKGYLPMQRCLMLGHSEGESGFSKHVKKQIKKICKTKGATYLTGYPVRQWIKGRYKDAYLKEDLHDFRICIDTLETSVCWDNLHEVHQKVRKYIKSRKSCISMTHCSHFYAQGTNLYFIFITPMSNLEDFRQFHQGLINEIESAGGSLSHHHGVGRMMAPWLEQHLGKEQLSLLRAIKKHLDPHNIMNPGGQLGLDLDSNKGQ